MKKFWIITLSIFLSIVLIITCVFAYDRWQYVQNMEYCSFDLNGEDEVTFYYEDGRCYKSIPFPEVANRFDIVDTLSSTEKEIAVRTAVEREGVFTSVDGKNQLFLDPFGEGSEYAVIAPLPELPPIFPVCSIALPFAYYVVEVEIDE